MKRERQNSDWEPTNAKPHYAGKRGRLQTDRTFGQFIATTGNDMDKVKHKTEKDLFNQAVTGGNFRKSIWEDTRGADHHL